MRITKKNFSAFILLGFFSLALIILAHPTQVFAQANPGMVEGQEGLTEISRVYGADEGGPVDIRALVAKIINIVLGFIGAIFLGLAVFAGFEYMTAAGNQDQTKKAIGMLKNAIIGVLIILISWGVTRMVLVLTGKAVNNSVDYRTYQTYP